MIKDLRKKKGMTQETLAKQLGVTISAVCFWETGKRFPRKEMLDKLCGLFGCTIDELINGESAHEQRE